MAIEPMNRMAGSSISRDINRRSREQAERNNIKSCRFRAMRQWRISELFKRFFAVTINYLRDGARPSVWSKMFKTFPGLDF
jgi:hypothetical protein